MVPWELYSFVTLQSERRAGHGSRANNQMTGTDGPEGRLLSLERVHPGGHQEAKE